ncbi:aminotransferase class I/II-fold pyridoxal phosphate-dependent enzyme [Siminovitchia acidinfaciens]|uniref:Aminotransferase class I/II-fold pyridoxal phosphate-dependent enzyme n=1 Tax=Siminovitchia acidinfaciens TaxID=2321395 RepID=A0A429XZH6_9BACI|nr:aminotransferase class I/II-fold pyridoxal phosphate-dependent enzyme [Siminovitchia acidinfaciens]RST74180.1 aminotransferase class I/II-fold pyridoxal phosphate-dependent enzyme [Siminovitchia acidinfaciens]
MSLPKILLSPPHLSGNEEKYIEQAIKTNWIAPLGPNVDAFERELSQYVGSKGAAVTSSGTAAIHLALELLDVGQGDKVFCSSFTFVASANPILYQGAEPVFIDSEPDTWNMSPHALERALEDAQSDGELPKAVIVVNLYGQSAKMDEIVSLCNQYGVPVVEDAAESLGSEYKGKKSGTFGKFGIYSFNGNKIITTSGGGMLVSDDEEALDRARFLATQAREPALHYEHCHMGYNYRLSNILAGVGRAQLEVLDDRVAARRRIFERYVDALADIPGIELMPELEGTLSNRWLTTFTIDPDVSPVKTDKIIQEMGERNIESRPLWKPLHLQPLFKGARFYPHEEDNVVSEQLFASGLCLPSGSSMSDEDQDRVIDAIKNSVRKQLASFVTS